MPFLTTVWAALVSLVPIKSVTIASFVAIKRAKIMTQMPKKSTKIGSLRCPF